jgi:glucose-6-phosphate isomerase
MNPRSDPPPPDSLPDLLEERLQTLLTERFVERLCARDGSLWQPSRVEGGGAPVTAQHLGWLRAARPMRAQLDSLRAFVTEIRSAGVDRVVVLAEGGPALYPRILQEIFANRPGHPRLQVLDCAAPAAVRAIGDDLDQTLFLVASKSGETIGLRSFYRHFSARLADGRHFFAITDPGSALETLARETGFRRAFTNPPDVCGSYSVLTLFGLLPALLIGVEVERLLDSAADMADACARSDPDNPGLRLGAALATAALQGRNKLHLISDPELAPFSRWIEQLVTESTGKGQRGIVPLPAESIATAQLTGNDHLLLELRLGSPAGYEFAAEGIGDHPTITIRIPDRYALGGEFLRWETAAVTAATILGVDPFARPEIAAGRHQIEALLQSARGNGERNSPLTLVADVGLRLQADAGIKAAADPKDCLRQHLQRLRADDYLALVAYFHPTPALAEAFDGLRLELQSRCGRPATLAFGPRSLHSSGQLHHGGIDQGLFFHFAAIDDDDLPIPGEAIGFAALKEAQSLGAFDSLVKRDRRVLRCQFSADPVLGLQRLHAIIKALPASLFS